MCIGAREKVFLLDDTITVRNFPWSPRFRNDLLGAPFRERPAYWAIRTEHSEANLLLSHIFYSPVCYNNLIWLIPFSLSAINRTLFFRAPFFHLKGECNQYENNHRFSFLPYFRYKCSFYTVSLFIQNRHGGIAGSVLSDRKIDRSGIDFAVFQHR